MSVQEAYLIHDGYFEIDSGMLYYGIPEYFGKKVWARLNSLLLKVDQKWILIDSGMGVLPEKLKKYYPQREEGALLRYLDEMKVGADEIWGVVQTHLHLDHVGWGRHFPNARIFAQVDEIRYSFFPDRFQKGGYLKEQLRNLNFVGINGEEEILPKVRVVPTPGHTPGHQSVIIEGGDKKIVFTGDACPTRLNMEKEWIVGVLYNPVDELNSLKYLKSLKDKDAIFVFSHDSDLDIGALI